MKFMRNFCVLTSSAQALQKVLRGISSGVQGASPHRCENPSALNQGRGEEHLRGNTGASVFRNAKGLTEGTGPLPGCQVCGGARSRNEVAFRA